MKETLLQKLQRETQEDPWLIPIFDPNISEQKKRRAVNTLIANTLKQAANQYEREKGIKQGTLYGYELRLVAPEDVHGEVINENTLKQHIEREKVEMVEEIISRIWTVGFNEMDIRTIAQKYGVDLSE